MAKKSSKAKKTRFGNPATAAAAEGATASNVISFSEAVAQRAKAGRLPAPMDRLVPAFKDWMAAAGVPTEEIPRLASLLMNYFKNYTASVSSPDPTKLDVKLTGQILEDAGRFHPEMRVSVSLALNSYLKFLMTTQAWTGPRNDLVALLSLTDEKIFAPSSQELALYVYHDGSDPAAAGADRAVRPYVLWTAALLEWIGDGRELTATGLLRRKDIAAAAACVEVDALGSASVQLPSDGQEPARTVTSMAHVPRLMQYWHALIDTNLIRLSGKKVEPTRAGRAFLRAPALALQPTAQLAYCLFYDEAIPYDDADPAASADAAVARLLAAAASSAPNIAIPFEPAESSHPFDLSDWRAYRVTRSLTDLATAGLVEQGTVLVVPQSVRIGLSPVLERLDEMIAEAANSR